MVRAIRDAQRRMTETAVESQAAATVTAGVLVARRTGRLVVEVPVGFEVPPAGG